MLDVNELIKKTMKKEIFIGDLRNKAARQVLAELKTSFVDIREDITAEIQNKILKKMKSTREKTILIYKNSNANVIDNLNKEVEELKVICELTEILQEFLPKMMTEEEIKNKIFSIIHNNTNSKIGDIMKEFKNINADKALVSKIAKEIIEKGK